VFKKRQYILLFSNCTKTFKITKAFSTLWI